MTEGGVIVFLDELNPAMADVFYEEVPQGFTLVTRGPGEPIPPVEEADYVFVSSQRLPAEQIRRCRRARLIQKAGVGYDNIDVKAAAEMGIPVAITAGANAVAVAEHAVLLMLAVQRRLVEIHNATEAGEWRMWRHRHECYELAGKCVGLIGMGAIGREVAARVRAFGCEVSYFDAFRLSPEQEKVMALTFRPLEELLAWADIISLHVPLTATTKHLIDRKAIQQMKQTAILINTSRGPVVKIDDLAEALQQGRIFGAGLDVHDPEPIPPGYPLLGLPNVILTPHTGAGTRDTQRRVVRQAMQNFLRVSRGEAPVHVVTL